jgi:hypothetical protein
MAQVITFEGYTPAPRTDGLPWTQARIDEADTSLGDSVTGDWLTIDTVDLDPVDADPSLPQPHTITTELASDTAGLWYRIVFLDASGDFGLPTTPVQNVVSATPYATIGELARILKLRPPRPTDAERAAMERVLITAAGEIDAEVNRAADLPLAGWELALAAEVNLERAVEHWRQQESPFGIIGLGAEFGATHTARDSWERHAHKLAPLKGQWGLA